MRIAHLFQGSNTNFSQSQAAQLHIYHTIRGLQQTGHQVDLLALQGRDVLFTNDLHIFKDHNLEDGHFGQLGLSGKSLFKFFESAIRRIQTTLNLPYLALFDSYRLYEACQQNLQGYDLIHERYNLLAVGGALASRKLGLPFYLEVNADLIEQRKFKGTPEKGIRRLWAIWSTRICFNAATKIICISDELKEHLHHKWNVPIDKLVVLPCAADIEAFGQQYNTQQIRRDLGIADEPVVMWIGGFYRWHDLDLLLTSFAQVLQKFPEAKLVLVGDGETRPLVEQQVSKNGFRNSVILTGSIEHKKIPEILSIADITVVPSAPVSADQGGTGTPLKLFEYMAAGKAIVATALDHASSVIQNEYNGVLVEPGNIDAFAEAILRVLSDQPKRLYLAQNARQEAVEKYSWDHYTQQLEEIYLATSEND